MNTIHSERDYSLELYTDEEINMIDDMFIPKVHILIKRLTDTAKIPTQGSEYAAGYDLYVDCKDEVLIRPHTTMFLKTGLAMAIPKGYYGAIYARSGLATRQGLRPPNCVGIIDADYRGEIGIPLHNDLDTTQTIAPYQRVAQMIVQPCWKIAFDEVGELEDTDRGIGGFGSTGEK